MKGNWILIGAVLGCFLITGIGYEASIRHSDENDSMQDSINKKAFTHIININDHFYASLRNHQDILCIILDTIISDTGMVIHNDSVMLTIGVDLTHEDLKFYNRTRSVEKKTKDNNRFTIKWSQKMLKYWVHEKLGKK